MFRRRLWLSPSFSSPWHGWDSSHQPSEFSFFIIFANCHQHHVIFHRQLNQYHQDLMIVTGGAPLPGEAGAWVGRFQKGKWTIMLMIMMIMMMMNKMKLW